MNETATLQTGIYDLNQVFPSVVFGNDPGVIPQNPMFDTSKLIQLFARINVTEE